MDSLSLWTAAAPIAQACLAHPFLSGIADGTLPRPAFAHYVAQDAVFLDAFVRAYALGLAKAPDRPTMTAFKGLLDGALTELDLHRGYAERWGVDLDPVPSPAARAYTDFLLRVAALEPAAHICAAMTPCMRLYAWLGQQLAPRTDPASPYAEWVHTYGSADFEQLAATVETLLDDLDGDAAVIAERYDSAMRLELAFFDSAHQIGTTA